MTWKYKLCFFLYGWILPVALETKKCVCKVVLRVLYIRTLSEIIKCARRLQELLLPEATVIWPNGKQCELLTLYSPVPTEPKLCSLHYKTNKQTKKMENAVFVSYNISMHAHSKTFSFMSEKDKTERIKWVLHHLLHFIIHLVQRKRKIDTPPFFSGKSDLMVFTALKEKHVLQNALKIKKEKKNTTFSSFQRCESWFSDGTEPSLGDEQDAALHSLPVLPYHTVSHFWQVSRMFYMSSQGTAVELAVKRTVCDSINVSDRPTSLYYLHWVFSAKSGSVRATITRSGEGDLPAAPAAVRSSLLSAPITGASVPTKTNSVVQPSEHPLPLPEPLPSSPAAMKSHQLDCTLKYLHN